MPIRIIIADDHQIVREGLCSLLKHEEDIEIVAQASDGDTVLRLVKKHSPDIVIMDISMPGLNGIEATRRISAKFPDVKVIALSMHSYRRFIMEMLKAGASGYLLKNCAFDELGNAVRTVAAGRNYISPTLMGDALIESYVQDFLISEPSSFSVLTEQDRRVFQFFAQGYSVEQIMGELAVSSEFIETVLNRILKELHLENIEELTNYAIREGLA